MAATVHAGDYVVCTTCKAQSPVLPVAVPGRTDNPTMAWKADHQEVYHPNQPWAFEVRPHRVDAVYVVIAYHVTLHGCSGAFSSRDIAERRARDLEERFGETVHVIECPIDVAHALRVIPGDPMPARAPSRVA